MIPTAHTIKRILLSAALLLMSGTGLLSQTAPAAHAACIPVAFLPANVGTPPVAIGPGFDTSANVIQAFTWAREQPGESCSPMSPISINQQAYDDPNASAQDRVLMLVNAERHDRNQPALTLDKTLLSRIAFNHSREMVDYNYFDHPSPINQPRATSNYAGARACAGVVDQNGVCAGMNSAVQGHYTLCCAENIYGNGKTPAQAVFEFMYQDAGSSCWGHRQNILGYSPWALQPNGTGGCVPNMPGGPGRYTWVGIGIPVGGQGPGTLDFLEDSPTSSLTTYVRPTPTPTGAPDTEAPSLNTPTLSGSTLQVTSVRDNMDGSTAGVAGVTGVVFYFGSAPSFPPIVATQSSPGTWTAQVPAGANTSLPLHAVAVDGSGNYTDCAFGSTTCTAPAPGCTAPVTAPPLLGCWPLNEGSGLVAGDTSGNGHPGQLTAMPGAPLPTWITDPNGLRFQGQQFVNVPTAPVLEPPTVTVAAWVRSPQPLLTDRHILDKGADACFGGSYQLSTGPTGGLFFFIRSARGLNLSPGPAPTAIWDGRWHQVVGTYDGQLIRLFVDYVEMGPGTPEPGSIQYQLPTSNDLSLGAYRGTCQGPFTGDISNVRIWGRALTPAEIGALAPAPVVPVAPPPPPAGPIGVWPLNEGSGAVAGDTSGNSNPGQLTAMPGALLPTWIPGPTPGTAGLGFQGQQFVNVPAAAVLEPPTVTAAAWVRSTQQQQQFGYILSKGAADCQGGSYAFLTGGPPWQIGALFFYIRSARGLGLSPGAAPAAVWDGRWHQIVGTYDGQSVRLYVDGVEVGSGTLEPGSIQYQLTGTGGLPPTVATHDLSLGMYRGCQQPFSGDISNVRIWGRALAPAEIGAL